MLGKLGATRLCYAGSVLRTQPDGLAQSRQPLQIGAELFGHAGVESDIEIQDLMVKALQAAGVAQVQIDLSHVAIFASLIESYPALEANLYAALQAKDQTAVRQLTAKIDAPTREALCALTELNGGLEVLALAEKRLPATPAIQRALQELTQIANALTAMQVRVSVDLSELRGYHYHSGVVFAAYAQGFAGALALGGRYDEVGKCFGRARAATGFSIDLRGIVKAQPVTHSSNAIFAPALKDAALCAKIEALRASGERVIQGFAGQEAHNGELHCKRQLIQKDGVWQVLSDAM
jgi:ATP phosphoribosyltransferase regulatory subunit